MLAVGAGLRSEDGAWLRLLRCHEDGRLGKNLLGFVWKLILIISILGTF